MQNNRSITEDTRFNVKNHPNAEGKNYGRHPVNLHYIECGYGMPEICNALSYPKRRLTRKIQRSKP